MKQSNNGLRPQDYSIGSPESRAAARAKLESLRLAEKEVIGRLTLEERTLSYRDIRKRRLERVPLEGLPVALEKARRGKLLTETEFVLANLGFLPQEWVEAHEAEENGEAPWRGDWKPKSLVLGWVPNERPALP